MAKKLRGVHLIAEIAGVSRGTVDRALHGRGEINDATRQRVLEIARQIGYRPNPAARALSVHRQPLRSGYVFLARSISFMTNCGAEYWKKRSVFRRLALNSQIVQFRTWVREMSRRLRN